MRITKEALLSCLPPPLAEDRDMRALAEVIAARYAALVPDLVKLRIYPSSEDLEETLLDILAYDFSADWWDGGMTLTEKREAIRHIWEIHRLRGTKGGVERAVGAIYPGTAVAEWQDYGGVPYHFRIDVPVTRENAEDGEETYKARVFYLISIFKNLRSVIDDVYFSKETPIGTALSVSGSLDGGLSITRLPEYDPMAKAAFETELYISAAAPRWHETRITNDLTPVGQLAVGEFDGGTGIDILADVAQRGGHALRVWDEDDEIVLECEGLTAEEDDNGTTINIQGG